MGVLLTLFQPEGADYAHHITASTPGFENLKTALMHVLFQSQTICSRLASVIRSEIQGVAKEMMNLVHPVVFVNLIKSMFLLENVSSMTHIISDCFAVNLKSFTL